MAASRSTVEALGIRVMGRLEALARCSETPDALTRRFLTAAHRQAMLQIEAWMRDAGMAVHIDPIANVIGRREGSRPGAPAILLGSHIDTVVDAGKYDGNFGVIAAIEAVAALAQSGHQLAHPLEVVAFGDEEGVRFPSHLLSSRALIGAVAPDLLDAADADGVSVRQALAAFGLDPNRISDCTRSVGDIAAYLEVHIEQGPVLQSLGQPLAAVTAINGATRMRVAIKGETGHAGTVPMRLRRDALAAAAEMVLAVERIGSGAQEELVATVGRLDVAGGAPNVVAGDVRFTVDVRSPADAVRADALARIRAEIAQVAGRRHVESTAEVYYDMPATPLAPRVVDAVATAIAECGHQPVRLASGAGHDAMAIAPRWPTGMMFVRCKDGISHNPAEEITAADAGSAVAALIAVVRHLDQHLLTTR